MHYEEITYEEYENLKDKTGAFHFHTPTGGELWHLDGKPHRVDGPAVICSNTSEAWYLNGLIHRTDGPAVIFREEWLRPSRRLSLTGDVLNFNSKGYKWFLGGEEYQKEEWFNRLTQEQLAIALSNTENF